MPHADLHAHRSGSYGFRDGEEYWKGSNGVEIASSATISCSNNHASYRLSVASWP